MNDNKLKELFSNDNSAPPKPTNEWPEILTKMESKKTKFSFYPPVAGAMFVLTLVIIGMSVTPNFKQMYDDDLGEYVFSDSYFDEESEYSFYLDEI